MPIIGPGGGGPFLTAKKHITSAQILALNTTPQVIVPAPGAGKILIPQRVMIVYHFGTVDYTSTNGWGVNWQGFPENITDPLSDSSQWFPTVTAQGHNQDVFWSTGGAVSSSGPGNSVSGNDVSAFTNLGLILFSYNANPSAGDGTLDVTTLYQVFTP